MGYNRILGDSRIPDCIYFSDFNVWDSKTNDIGHCFLHICLQLPIFSLLAVSSAYYIGKRRWTYTIYNSWNACQSSIIYIRAILVAFLALISIADLMLRFGFYNMHVGFLDGCIVFLKTCTWILHLCYVLRLKRGISYNTRGPRPIMIAWLFTGIISALEYRSMYFMSCTSDEQCKEDKIFLWSSGIEALLQGFYFLTIIPGGSHLDERHYRSIFTEYSSAYESHSVLNHETNSFVGFQEEDEQFYLGRAKENSGFISKIGFGWVNQLMVKGSCGYLRYSDDLFELPMKITTSTVATNFQKWTLHTGNSLIKSLHICFGWEFYSLAIVKFIGDASGFAGPILLSLLVGFIETNDLAVSIWNGYLYVFGLFLAALIGAIANTHFNMWMAEVNLKIRAAIITSIYRKTVLLQRTTLEKFNSGELINYMSSDTNRIINFCPSFHAFWSLPVQICVSLYLLYREINIAFLAGVTFAILLIPVNKFLANKIGELSTKMMHFKDQRVKLMSEILYGIRVLKFHSWECFFIQRISEIRQQELSCLRGRKYLDAWCVYFWATTPVLVSVLSFGTYVLLGYQLSAAKVFTSLALFNMLIGPLNALPWVLNGVVEAWVSVKRISTLLQAKETEPHDVYTSLSTELVPTHDIITSNTRFEWGEHIEDFKIDSFSIEIKKGQLIGIVGEVGMGKSSFLLSILGELLKTSGELNMNDIIINSGFGVVLQEPWIQRGTIRRNILFGKKYIGTFYSDVINGCCLDQDLYELEMGEDTIVGDNGTTLSGGQKFRLTLARAVYQDKSVYLLDDIFSAVDFKVAKHLYKHCLMGLLKQKTRIVCTHHVNFLRGADLILVMDGGRIIKSGTPNEILPIFFEDEMRDFDNDYLSTSFHSEQESQLQGSIDVKKVPSLNLTLNDSQSQSISINYNNRFTRSCEFINKPEDNAPPKEMNEEHGHEGTINLQVYKFYLRAVGNKLVCMILLALFAMQASKNSSDLWLAYWVTETSNDSASTTPSTPTPAPFTLAPPTFEYHMNDIELEFSENNNLKGESSWVNSLADQIYLVKDLDPQVKHYFTIFIIIGIVNSVFTLARAFLFAYGGVKGGTAAHIRLLRTVLHAKMSFFDTTSIGRIINRFSSDVSSVDDSLPFILNIFLAQLYGVLGTLFLTCYALPWILIVIIPLILVVGNIQQYYRYTARQLRRLSSVSLSPIYAHFSETLKGLVTIRAMRASRRFEDENEAYLEANQRCQYSTQAVSQWLAFRLQMVGVLVITGVGLISIIQHKLQVAEPGIIGLAISYALTITSSLSGFVTFFTDSEKEMVAVERIHEYVEDIEMESSVKSMVKPPYGWPAQGVLCFRNVYLRYRDGLSYSLRNISFETRPCEKIGIVGRTGSGKSSLFQALFRLVDDFEGEIILDTVNTKRLNLHDLRSKMWIIPQDPLIFSGTMRENLDPKGTHNDDEILSTLQKCQLNGLLQQIGGLDGDVGESGSFLSTGQKQLVCLARALLVNAKILCIDEATANVDQETDKIIQATIRTSFRHTTVITVAHRVNTILHSDRVIVMSNGEIVEIDGPEKLMLNKSSHFYQLAQGNV